jgi:hypothetical protein
MPQRVLHGESPRKRNEAVDRAQVRCREEVGDIGAERPQALTQHLAWVTVSRSLRSQGGGAASGARRTSQLSRRAPRCSPSQRSRHWSLRRSDFCVAHCSSTLHIRLFHIADDGLPAIVYMDVLDADKLLAAVTQASKNLNLHCISP